MCPGSQRVIIINGVRYNVAIRLDTNWSYVAEWWNRSEYHKHTFDDAVETLPNAEREAIDEIHKAHLQQEPWLHVEMA
jgi:hypothetical protein